MSGKSRRRSRANRSMTAVPQPSADCRSRMSRPISQYSRMSSRLTPTAARSRASRIRAFSVGQQVGIGLRCRRVIDHGLKASSPVPLRHCLARHLPPAPCVPSAMAAQGNPGRAHDGVEMRHRLLEGGVVERPALDRRQGRQRRTARLGALRPRSSWRAAGRGRGPVGPVRRPHHVAAAAPDPAARTAAASSDA